jgi:hypothetical protein
MAQVHESVAKSLRDGLRDRPYLLQQFVQASILQWIAINFSGVGPQPMAPFKFPSAPRGTVANLSVPAHGSANVTLSPSQIIACPGDNLFLREGMASSRLSLPERTKLQVLPPRPQDGTVLGEIVFSNPLFKLSVHTQQIFSDFPCVRFR